MLLNNLSFNSEFFLKLSKISNKVEYPSFEVSLMHFLQEVCIHFLLIGLLKIEL